MSGGRPSSYSPEIDATICDRLACGETLLGICREPEMPDQTTVYRWLRQNPEFRQRYARAREDQAEHWADEIIDIADTKAPEDTGRARLMIDARKWLMGKAAPKKYSDKVSHEVAGANGGPIQVIDVSKLTHEQLVALEPVLAALAGSGGAAGEGESGDPEAGG